MGLLDGKVVVITGAAGGIGSATADVQAANALLPWQLGTWAQEKGDEVEYVIGLPGETPETIKTTVKFAEELDCETIQVSIAHSYPGTELDDYMKKNNFFTQIEDMTDEMGHQLPTIQYPGLTREEIVQAVEHFYDRYYFRPRIIFRIVRRVRL